MEAKKKLIVGLFVGGALLLFAIGLFLIGSSTQLFTKSFEIYADFFKVTGIQIGAKVRVAGMDAGAVTVIEVPLKPDAQFRVRFRIAEKLHPLVRQDSVATIQTDGLLGNKFLEVGTGSEGSARVKSGSAIHSREPFDWGDLMDQLSETVNSVNTLRWVFTSLR
jgi:phospholipid/cholesterol/gamma-HCH transport system substrate-binding protein